MASVTRVESIEATGEKFSLQELLYVRARTRRAVHMIAEKVTVGMAEEEAKETARNILTSLGMRRGWHHIIVRCGPNTTKDFMERSEPGVVLEENDIFFIDIGPIFRDTEGDAGDTFVFGDDRVWFDERITGQALYHYAEKAAGERGWKLNLDLSGHRLSDYPHAAHYDGALAEVPFRPNPNLWVLEIAIAHPDRGFGAFYEDLLLEDQSFPEGILPV
jgi:methionyl aminopeptidase